MGRIANKEEDKRELEEGCLGCLGNAIILLELVQERIEFVGKISRQAELLEPAAGDLRRVKALIRRAQVRLAGGSNQ